MSAPAPGTAEWASKVTASKVAAILGLSPFDSPYSVWQLMAGNIDPAVETRPMKRGNMLENAVLDWWLDEHPEHREAARQKWYAVEEWAGATPDMDVIGPSDDLELVDAKTISRDDAWQDEPPAHYLASSLWQLFCAPEATRVHLAVLFGQPFDMRTYTIERDQQLIDTIALRCRDFYESLSAGAAPDLDDTVATYEAVRAMHPDIDPDLDVEISHDLAHEYVTASVAKKDAEAAERSAKTRLLDAMGRARIATFDGVKVARRQPRGDAVSLVRIAKHISHPDMKEAS